MIVYLNGEYMPAEAARISPFDRGFLYGDGIYEVTPSYSGRMVGFDLHLQRMKNGLREIGIDPEFRSDEQWRALAEGLMERNGKGNLGVYFQVSRGNEGRRFHGFPIDIPPTVFAMTLDLDPHPESPNRASKKGLKVALSEDRRWRRCQVKSTALLGNILHFQQGYAQGLDETILYNAQGELTEASQSNVFIVKNGVVITPLLDTQLLPGISRHMALASLRAEGSIPVEERLVTMDEVRGADEIWITNSSRHIAPVVELDGKMVGDGKVGPIWERAMCLYEAQKYNF